MRSRGGVILRRGNRPPAGPIVLMVLAVVVAAGAAFALPYLPFEVGAAAALALIPGILVALAVLRYPFFGLCVVYIMMYFRPQDMVGALKPLHLPLLSTAGLALVFIFLLIRDPKRKLYWPGPMWSLTALMVLMAVSVLTSVNNYWAYQFFRGTLQLVILVFLTVNLVTSVKEMQKVIGLLIGAHLYVCFKGLSNFIGGGGTTGRTGSNFFGDENDLALALIVMFPYAFFSISRSKTAGRKFLWATITFIMLVTIMASMSRGGFVGIVAVLGFIWLQSPHKIRNAVALVLLVAIVALLAPPEYYEEIASIKKTNEGTANLRKEYWMAGFRMYGEYPLMGVGQGNSKLYLPMYMDVANANTKWGRAMHGTIPLLVAELGSAGLLIYIVLLGQCTGLIRRSRRVPIRDETQREYSQYLSLAAGGGIVGFLVCSTFLSALYYPHIYVLVGFTAVAWKLTHAQALREKAA